MSSQRFSPEFMDEAVKTIQSGVQARSGPSKLRQHVKSSICSHITGRRSNKLIRSNQIDVFNCTLSSATSASSLLTRCVSSDTLTRSEDPVAIAAFAWLACA